MPIFSLPHRSTRHHANDPVRDAYHPLLCSLLASLACRNQMFAVAFAAILSVLLLPQAAAVADLDLGSAAPFAIIAYSTVTATGVTAVLALSPGSSVTGFPPATLTGYNHVTDTTAANALADANIACKRSFKSVLLCSAHRTPCRHHRQGPALRHYPHRA
jgi:hypothetical protein